MHKIGLSLYRLASRLIGIMPGKGQGNFQKNFRMRFFLLQYQFRSLGFHAHGIPADKMCRALRKHRIDCFLQPSEQIRLPWMSVLPIPRKMPVSGKATCHASVLRSNVLIKIVIRLETELPPHRIKFLRLSLYRACKKAPYTFRDNR